MSDISDLDKTADSLRRAGAAVRDHALRGGDPGPGFRVDMVDYEEDQDGGWSGTMTTSAHTDEKYEVAFSPETGRVAIDVVKKTQTLIIDHKVPDQPDYKAVQDDPKPYNGMATDD